MGNEQLRLSESGDANARLEKAIGAYEDIVFKAEQDPNPKTAQQLENLIYSISKVFKSNPGKWPAKLIEDTYALIKRAGAIQAQDTEEIGVAFVKQGAKLLLEHLNITDENRPLIHTLLTDKVNFNFVREIKYDWLGKKGMAKFEKVGSELYDFANNKMSEQNFASNFARLTGGGFDAYVDQILKIDLAAEGRTTDAKSKILLGLIQYLYSGLVSNPNVSVETKRKVLEFNQTVLAKVPGLFGEKLVAEAESVGIGLQKAKVKTPKKGTGLAKGPSAGGAGLEGKKKAKPIDVRLASERISQTDHEYVSIASINPDDVIVFDYKESNERVLAMPEIMKIQLNSVALIGDLAEGYWKWKQKDLGDDAVRNGQFAIKEIDEVQKNIVDYYRSEKYDGKTPFNLGEGLKSAMGMASLNKLLPFVDKEVNPKCPYSADLMYFLEKRTLPSLDDVKKVGLAIAWIQKDKFDDFMSARGLMAKLLHKDVMAAREKLPPELQKELAAEAYADAGKYIRDLLYEGSHMKTYRANFPQDFAQRFGRPPTTDEVEQGAKGHISALWEAQHVLLYDSYLTWAALSKQYIKPDQNLHGIDKDIYTEFCKSVDPDGGTFRLDDKAKATLYPIMKEVGIMALSFGAAWVASSIARVGIGLVRGASLFQKTTKLARLAQYAAEGGMFLGKTAFEAGAFSYSDAKLRGDKTFIDVAIDEDAWKAAKMISGEMAMFGGFHVAGGVLKFLKMGAEGRVLMKYSAGNTKHARVIEKIFALAKNSPAKAIEVMDALVKNGGKIAEIEGLAKLGKGVLPREVLESFGKSIKKIELMKEEYGWILNRIKDPRIKNIVGLLVADLNFDAAAIMIGTYAKEYIDPKDRPKVEATIWDHYKEAYLTAGVFKAVFGGLGKVAEKLPAAVEAALPKAMRERFFKSYQNSKGEFIGRDGLVQMLTGELEGEGFESGIVKIEMAKDLILTAQDVLYVTSKLPKEKRTRFLDACKRIMKPEEKQSFVDNVLSMKIDPSDIPKDFKASEADSVPVEVRRRVEGELQGARAKAREAAGMPAEALPEPTRPEPQRRTEGPTALQAVRNHATEAYLSWLLTFQALGAGVGIAEKAMEKPAEVAMAKPGDFAPKGRFNLPLERVAKMPKASEKSKVVLVNSNAKTPESSLKDFSEFDFSISQDSIFEGMKKAGVDVGNIEAMKAAYAALPDIVKPYYRVFGSNVDGKFEHHLAINNEDFAKNAEKIMHAGLLDAVIQKVLGAATDVIGWGAKKAVVLSVDAIWAILKESSGSLSGAYGIGVLIAWFYYATLQKKGLKGGILPALLWPIPGVKRIPGVRDAVFGVEAIEAKPLKPLPEIIAALHLDGINPGNHYGLDHAGVMQLTGAYNGLKPSFENLKGSHELFDKVIQAIFLRLRLRRIDCRFGEIRERRSNINGNPNRGIDGELPVEQRKIANRQAEVQRLVGVENTNIRNNQRLLDDETSNLMSLERSRNSEPFSPAEIARLESTASSLQGEIGRLTAEITRLDVEIRKLERSKSSKAEEVRNKNSEITSLNSSIGTSDPIPELEGKITALEDEILSLPKDAPDLRRREATLEKMKSDLKKLRRIEELKTEIKTLKDDIGKDEDNIDAKSAESSAKIQQKNTKESELNRAKARIENPTKTLTPAEQDIRGREITATKRRIEDLNEAIAKSKEAITKLKDEDKDKTITDANKKIEELRAEIKKLDEEVHKLHEEEHGLTSTLTDPTNGLLFQIITDGWNFNPDKRLKRVDMQSAIRKVLTDSGMPDREARMIVNTIIDIVDILLIHAAPGFRGLEKSQKLVEGLRPTNDRATGIDRNGSVEGHMSDAMNAAYEALRGDVNSQWEGMNPLVKGLRGIDKALPHHPAWRKFVIALILSLVGGGYYYLSDHKDSEKKNETPTPKVAPAPGTPGTSGTGGSAAEARKIENSPFPKEGNPTKWKKPPVDPANAHPNGAPVVPTETEVTDLNKKAAEARAKAEAPKSTDEDQANAEAAEAAAKQAEAEIAKAKKAQQKAADPTGIDDLEKAVNGE